MSGAGGATSAAVADLVAVMDRLRSPGGCPWDAQQTHASLVPYAVEEVFEVVEAIETDDRDALLEELGDLLLQVVFHARVAAEHPTAPFGLDDVAEGIAAKLRRRHPHVFDPTSDDGREDQHTRWERLKQVEKNRTSVLDGIPLGMPALARAQKVLSRARRAGLDAPHADPAHADPAHADPARSGGVDATEALGARLLGLVAEAQDEGIDAEGALRAAVRALEVTVRDRESASRSCGPT